MAEVTLDRTKHFCGIFGISDHAYEQNHRYFDKDGNFIRWENGWEPKEAPKPAPKEVAPEVVVEQEPVEETKPEVVKEKPGERSREEIMAELDSLNVKYDARVRKSVLERLLIESKSDAARPK